MGWMSSSLHLWKASLHCSLLEISVHVKRFYRLYAYGARRSWLWWASCSFMGLLACVGGMETTGHLYVFYHCCNQLPPTERLKATQTCNHTVLWTKVGHGSHWAKIKVLAELCSFQMGLGEKMFPCLFPFRKDSHIPQLRGPLLFLQSQKHCICLTLLL